jgi:hypothetical protein
VQPEWRGGGRQLVGKTKDFGKEYIKRGRIFIVLKNINNDSGLEPLLINFISNSSKLEPPLILLVIISSDSRIKQLLIRILSARL